MSANTGMAEKTLKIIADTNIIISGLGFGGKPRMILEKIAENKIKAYISPVLLSELEDVVSKKFPKLFLHFGIIQRLITKKFKLVYPQETITILEDDDDNRVLEAAKAGKVSYIVTGDRELLDLGNYEGIKILTAYKLLKLL